MSMSKTVNKLVEISFKFFSHDKKLLDKSVIKPLTATVKNAGIKIKVIPLPRRKTEYVLPISPHCYAKTNKVAYTQALFKTKVLIIGKSDEIYAISRKFAVPSGITIGHSSQKVIE